MNHALHPKREEPSAEIGKSMICVICKLGETQPDVATVTLERDSMTLVIKNVPALICGNCGEQYLDEQTSARLPATAKEAATAGVLISVRSFVAA